MEASTKRRVPNRRPNVIRGHRRTIDTALAKYELTDEQRAIIQKMSDRLGVIGRPVQPDMIGQEPDTEPLPEGPRPPIGNGRGREVSNIRKSGEFLQAQPWLVPSIEMLCEWELGALGRPPVPRMRVGEGARLDELWAPLCAWAVPLRRDKPGRFRLARRAAEFLLGEYPWEAEWMENASGVLAPSIRKELEHKAEIWLDFARDTGCGCPACVSRRQEVAEVKRKYEEKYG